MSAPKTFKTKTSADHWLVDIEAALRKGELPDLRAGRQPFEKWAQHWLDTRQVRKKTLRGYTSIVDNHLVPEFGPQAINSIDRTQLTAFLAELHTRGVKEGTVANIRRVFSMVMNEATRSGAITRNPAEGVRVRRSRRAEMVFLTRDQVRILGDTIASPVVRRGKQVERRHYPAFDLLVRFVSETGLRAGEVAALRIGNVDLANRRIDVVASATEVPTSESPSGLSYGETKTYETRSVPMPKAIAADLGEHLKTRPDDRLAFVFTTVDGRPIQHSRFYNRHFLTAVAQAVDEKGKRLIPENTRFHDLRHTYAALLIAAGANPLTVKQRMGHSSITVTMDRYGHLFPHLEEDLTDRMDAAYREIHGIPELHADCTNEAESEGKELEDGDE